MNEKSITHFELDPDHLPALTEKQKARLEALSHMPDEEIDYSDIPPVQAMYKPVKKLTTIRIDADVLAWLKSTGKGYQTRINAILRREMLKASRRESELSNS